MGMAVTHTSSTDTDVFNAVIVLQEEVREKERVKKRESSIRIKVCLSTGNVEPNVLNVNRIKINQIN